MKVYLAFDSQEEAMEALQANDMAMALAAVSDDVFRPARKHGYHNPKLSNLSDREVEIIGELESMFYDVLRSHGVLKE